MATNDKLWFEMGVRDEVSKSLEKAIAKAQLLDDVFEQIMKKKPSGKGPLADLVGDALSIATEKAKKLQTVIIGIDNELRKIEGRRSVHLELNDNVNPILKTIEGKILELTPRLKELGDAINKTMAIQSKDPNSANLAAVEQLTNEYKRLETQINTLYSTYDKLSQRERQVVSGGSRKSAKDSASVFLEDMRNEQKIEASLQMNRHRLAMEQARDDAEVAAAAREVNAALEKQARAQREAMQRTREHGDANRSLINTYYQVAEAASQSNKYLDQIRNQMASYVSLYGAERLLRNVITIGGQFEVQHVALQNILGDVQEANTLFSQLQSLAVESPKTFQELTSYAKQLSAYQIPANELYDTTKRLADMSSGLGVDMNRLILAYGQVRSAAVLRGQELRQFTEAGIPMVQALADKFTEMNGKITTTADVFKLISQRAVSFEMVKEVLWDMTSQGGQFYNMQSELADTLYGKWQKLQDQWQITLGHIADGKSAAGAFLKMITEGLVNLTAAFDTLLPLIGTFALGRFLGGVKSSLTGILNKNTGATAIRNMEVAMLKEANRLERERVLYGKQLTEAEQKLVAAHGKLRSEDYYILAIEGQITKEKAKQLMLEGEMSREHYKQLMDSGLGVNQKSMASRLGGSLLGFLGGWTGVAITAIGGVITALDYLESKSDELRQKGDAMADHAQQNANTLSKALSSADADGSTEKHIEALEESLLQLGSTGESIVAKSREHMDDINERWRILKSGAESYQKVLSSLGGQQGKALFEKALDDSDIEANLKKYDDAVNDMFKRHSGLERYSELYEKAIEAAVKGNEQLAKQLEGRTLFDQIDIVGKDRLEKAIASIRDSSNFGLISAANEALGSYFRLQERVKAKWDEITNESIPAMSDELKAAAREIGITKFDQLTAEQKQSLETLTREYVNSIEGGSVEAKNRLAEELASQVFHIKIVGDLTIDSTKMSGFASYVWDKFGGNKQPKNNNINLPLFPWQTQQIGGGQQKVKIGNVEFTRQQVANIFEDVEKFAKDYNSQVDELDKKIKLLRKAGDDKLAANTEAEKKDLLSVLDALGLREEKTKSKGGSGGNKKDTVLEAAKTRLEEIKDFYSEYKKYRDQYGKDKAIDLVSGIFGMDKARAQEIVGNYKGILGQILAAVPQDGSEARKKWALTVKKLIGDIDLDAAKTELRKRLDELQRYIQDETSKWNLYKGLLDKTGSKEFAMQAFVDGVQWDDMTRGMAEKLREMMSSDKIAAHGGDLFEMDEEQAEKFFGKGTEELKLWQEIVKDIRKNWTDSLNEVASATEKLLTIEEKIAKTEQELAELRQKYGANDPRALAKEQELVKQQADAFEQSEDYLRFYSAILSMTIDEAEKMGLAIKKNLVDQLAKGGINADKYLKSIKNIDQQLEKARSHTGQGRFFIEGGLEGQAQRKYNAAYDDFSAKALAVQEAEKALLAARKNGDEYLIEVAERRLEIARMELETAEKRAILSEKELKALQNFSKDLGTAIEIIHGMQEAVNAWQDLAKAVDGEEMEVSAWFEDTLGALDGIGQGLQNVVQSAMSGNISGMIGGAVSLLANPVKVLSQNHDKRRQKEIENSERRVKALTTAYQNLEKAMESALGGIYATGGYEEMFENLQRQRDELQKQMDLEYDKKATDKDKIADYEQQLMEAEEKLKNYALDMAKALYDIDLHSWASQLTEAVVSAWENGEDAVEAYRSKVKEIMKDLSTNILAKKVMERAFESLGIDNLIAEMMDSSSGKLNENAIPRLAEALGQAGNLTVEAITKTLDQLEAQGSIERGGSSSSSSSMTNSIKGVTEETADLLASYINAIRADVSVNRMTLTEILYAVQGQSEMPMIARAQLQQLEQVAANTQRNADAAEMIYEMLNQNVLGALPFRVK